MSAAAKPTAAGRPSWSRIALYSLPASGMNFMDNLIGGFGYEHFLTDDDFSTMDYRIYTDLVIHF